MAVLYLDKKIAIGATITVIAVFVVGILIGFYGRGSSGSNRSGRLIDDSFQEEQENIAKIIKDISADKIGEFLEELTKVGIINLCNAFVIKYLKFPSLRNRISLPREEILS